MDQGEREARLVAERKALTRGQVECDKLQEWLMVYARTQIGRRRYGRLQNCLRREDQRGAVEAARAGRPGEVGADIEVRRISMRRIRACLMGRDDLDQELIWNVLRWGLWSLQLAVDRAVLEHLETETPAGGPSAGRGRVAGDNPP